MTPRLARLISTFVFMGLIASIGARGSTTVTCHQIRQRARRRADVLNAFNDISFLPVASASSSATLGQITSAYTDANNTQDPGGRLLQLVFRLSW